MKLSKAMRIGRKAIPKRDWGAYFSADRNNNIIAACDLGCAMAIVAERRGLPLQDLNPSDLWPEVNKPPVDEFRQDGLLNATMTTIGDQIVENNDYGKLTTEEVIEILEKHGM